MNISTHGVYFATDQKVDKGLLVQLHLKMPREIMGEDVAEWSFTGRVAHVEPLNPLNGKSGVGVQFLCYEVPRPVMKMSLLKLPAFAALRSNHFLRGFRVEHPKICAIPLQFLSRAERKVAQLERLRNHS